MRPTFRLYCGLFVLCTLVGLAGVAAINLAVDPLGAYPLFALNGVEPYRHQITSRPAKAEMLLRHECDVLLLGTSRVQVGIPVRHPGYGTNNVLNLGLIGTSLNEIAAVLDVAIKHQRPKRVLLGTDFLLFSDLRGFGPGFENSRFNPKLERLDYHFKNILGSQMLADSWDLLRQWRRRKPPAPGERGFILKSLRPGVSQRDVFARNIRRFLVKPEIYGAYHYSPDRLEVFRQMIRQCRDAGVELVVFLPPVHALQLETTRAAGLWPTFERWKGDLVRILADEGATATVPLWDFTGYSGRLAEAVPPAGDTTTRMKWYLENSHFTAELGNEVLNRLLLPDGGSTAPPDFGVRLATNNLAAHLSHLREDRESYAAAHPDEIAWVKEIAIKSKGSTVEGDADF